MSEILELLPDPIRMVEGLRDTGYQFNTAVADVVDNSIAAEASFVNIELKMDYRGRIILYIFDDGIGMDREDLINAMRYGSKPRPSAASLGKFGLGLKTASTAFCRSLSVISRNNASNPLLQATWNLDHIHDSNKWELLIEAPSKQNTEIFNKIINQHSGTLVIWQNIDRLLKNYNEPGGTLAKKAMTKICENLQFHLSTVYQRFLDTSDRRARNIKIILNGTQLIHWDPFMTKLSQLVNTEKQEVELENEKIASFEIKAFILPRKEEFPSEDIARSAKISNANQGIYIYRENRLIHGPDWLKMFTKEPHFSLLRIEFSFDHLLDDAFQVDIKKSQILLNEAIYDHVIDFLTPIRRAAEEVYRKGTKAKTAVAAKSAHDSSNRNISSKEDQITKPEIKSVDSSKNEAQIVNSQGSVRLKLKITNANKPQEVHIQPTPSIDDGLLWEPCIIDGHWGVRINTNHQYYSKVYLPNLTEGVTIQGMDALLWGLSVAELNCVNETTKSVFSELRYEVSRNLRKLVEDLPDPKILE